MLFDTSPYSMKPDAKAVINGNRLHSALYGIALFYQTPYGVLINAQFQGLPSDSGTDKSRFLGFHIHENGNCSQNGDADFHLTGSHYNPENLPHPNHRGDLPPIFNCNGYAWQSFLTNAFTVPEIIGRSIVVHSSRDDFMTQPSGNSGSKIGCGIITLND